MTETFEEKQNSKSLGELISLLSNDIENLYPGGAEEEEIKELEEELGITLPPEYAEFQKKLGGGNFKYFRVYSIASEDETFYDLMEQIDVCLQWIPLVRSHDLLPFGDDYGGNIFCFNLRHARDGEYEIVQWHQDFGEEDEPKHIAYTFTEFIAETEFVEESSEASENNQT